MPRPGPDLLLETDPGAFLSRAARHLAADPVLNTVVASTAIRSRDALVRGRVVLPPDSWFCTVLGPSGPAGGPRAGRAAGPTGPPLDEPVDEPAGVPVDDRPVVGVAMRTGPLPDRACYLLPMPDEAAVALARLLHTRGETVTHVNGALPAVRVFAEETARLTGGVVRVGVHTRLFELTQPDATGPERHRRAGPVPGRLRTARSDELELVVRWWQDFAADADAQAGRPVGTRTEQVDPEVLADRIEDGRVWFWDDDGPVHLTGVNPVSFGAQRIGPVFTPARYRGQGYAGAAVSELSGRILAAGARPCLFTDQANPTSNRLYLSLGYRPVVDMVNLAVA